MLKNIRNLSFPSLNKCFSSNKEIYSQFLSRKTSKHRENQKLIESVFFPDYIRQSQKEEIEKIVASKSIDQKFLDESEFTKLLALQYVKSKGKDDLIKSNEKTNLKKHQQIIEMLNRARVNDKMLNIYLKFEKLFGRSEISFLMKKLEWSLQNEKSIKIQEKQDFEKKQENLKRIHEKVDLRFSAVFLSRTGILEHSGWKFLIKNTENKIEQGLYTKIDSILICKSILIFARNEFPQNLLMILRKVLN